MTAATLITFVGLFLAIFVVEFLLLYASTALGNVELNFPKWLVSAFLVAVVWAAVSFTCYALFFHGHEQPFAADRRIPLIGSSAAGLVLAWAIPALLFVPVFPVSIPRGMLVSVFQLLLRIFLYVLITAIVMVVLAIMQVSSDAPKKQPVSAAPVHTVQA